MVISQTSRVSFDLQDENVKLIKELKSEIQSLKDKIKVKEKKITYIVKSKHYLLYSQHLKFIILKNITPILVYVKVDMN